MAGLYLLYADGILGVVVFDILRFIDNLILEGEVLVGFNIPF